MSRRIRPTYLILVVLVLGAAATIAAGCGDDDGDDEGDAAAATSTTSESHSESSIPVSMGEWFIKPDTDTVEAGEVTFEVTNDGEVEHEFVVLKTDLPADKLPTKGGEVQLAEAGEVVGGAHEPGEEEEKGEEQEHEEEEHLEPGASASYEVDLEPGSYVLICNINGHYSAGQYAELTVE